MWNAVRQSGKPLCMRVTSLAMAIQLNTVLGASDLQNIALIEHVPNEGSPSLAPELWDFSEGLPTPVAPEEPPGPYHCVNQGRHEYPFALAPCFALALALEVEPPRLDSPHC